MQFVFFLSVVLFNIQFLADVEIIMEAVVIRIDDYDFFVENEADSIRK